MAVFYTNFLTGNDSTGTGTWANPFKTIYRGTQAIAGNGDEVRVVGSGWTDLPGTLTFTYNSTTINTSVDLTAAFPELTSTAGNNKVIITVDDEFGFGKSVFVVTAVTSTTLTLPTAWVGSSGVFNGKRLTTQHYYATAAPTSPLGSASTFESVDSTKIAAFENLKITGGWTADGVQNGITAFVNAYGTGTTSAGQFLNQSFTPPTTPQNLYISGFAFANVGNFNNSSGSRHAIGDLWFIRAANTFNSGSTDIVSLTGQYANLYAYDARLNASWQVSRGVTGGGLNLNLWHTFINLSNGQYGPETGGAGTTSNPWEAAKMFGEVHFRRLYTDSFMGFPNTSYWIMGATYTRHPLYVNELHAYATNTSVDNVQMPITGVGSTFEQYSSQVNKVYGYGPVGFTMVNPGGGSFTTLGDGTQSLNDLRLCSTGGNNVDIVSTARNFKVIALEGNFRAYGPVSRGGQTTNITMVVREETVEKVTGTNSLAVYGSRKHPGRTSAITTETAAPIAFIPSFTGTKTLTIKMKSSGVNPSQWTGFSIRLLTGGSGEIYEPWASTITGLSTSWQDFVYTIDMSSAFIEDQITMFPLHIEQFNLPDQQTGEILYIDSISLV